MQSYKDRTVIGKICFIYILEGLKFNQMSNSILKIELLLNWNIHFNIVKFVI